MCVLRLFSFALSPRIFSSHLLFACFIVAFSLRRCSSPVPLRLFFFSPCMFARVSLFVCVALRLLSARVIFAFFIFVVYVRIISSPFFASPVPFVLSLRLCVVCSLSLCPSPSLFVLPLRIIPVYVLFVFCAPPSRRRFSLLAVSPSLASSTVLVVFYVLRLFSPCLFVFALRLFASPVAFVCSAVPFFSFPCRYVLFVCSLRLFAPSLLVACFVS